jgi:hypothetical protein
MARHETLLVYLRTLQYAIGFFGSGMWKLERFAAGFVKVRQSRWIMLLHNMRAELRLALWQQAMSCRQVGL